MSGDLQLTTPTRTLASFGKTTLNLSLARHKEEKVFGGVQLVCTLTTEGTALRPER